MDLIGKMVVVTTDVNRRGVFFGRLAEDNGEEVTLEDARNAVYWSAETGGFLGLASRGPQRGSRVSPAAPSIRLNGVTSVSVASEEAVAAWEAGPWS